MGKTKKDTSKNIKPSSSRKSCSNHMTSDDVLTAQERERRRYSVKDLHISKNYFPNSRKFVYKDKKGNEHVIYGDRDLTKLKDVKIRWYLIPLFLLLIGITVIAVNPLLGFPKEPLKTYVADDVRVLDSANILTEKEESEMLESMQKFGETTGITAIVQTLDPSYWAEGFNPTQEITKANDAFPKFAVQQYYEHFNHENGWILVYSEANPNIVNETITDEQVEVIEDEITDTTDIETSETIEEAIVESEESVIEEELLADSEVDAELIMEEENTPAEEKPFLFWLESTQGDHTVRVTNVFIGTFNETLDTSLKSNNRPPLASSIIKAFDTASTMFKGQTFEFNFLGWWCLFALLFLEIATGYLLIFYHALKGYSYQDLEEVYNPGSNYNQIRTIKDRKPNDERPTAISCSQCGTTSFQTYGKKCPSCGAILVKR